MTRDRTAAATTKPVPHPAEGLPAATTQPPPHLFGPFPEPEVAIANRSMIIGRPVRRPTSGQLPGWDPLTTRSLISPGGTLCQWISPVFAGTHNRGMTSRITALSLVASPLPRRRRLALSIVVDIGC